MVEYCCRKTIGDIVFDNFWTKVFSERQTNDIWK
jgi:hypothetical protein